MTQTSTTDSPAQPEGLTGHRTFTWFTPARRKATEYELYTIGQQSGPDQWLKVGWPLHFDDGSPPWSDENSRIRSTNWRSYRDPAKLWERPYVSQANQDEQALARLVPTLVANGAAQMSQEWTKETLGRVYGAWPFVEYGLFLANSYGVRQAMADTIQIPIVFQCSDRLKLLQGIVIHIDELSSGLPGFTDEGAREAWMTDPALVPTREVIEHIVASEDWVEGLVVGSLIFEPILGRLAKLELFSAAAAANGDTITPTVVAPALRDADRFVSSTQALVRLVCADAAQGSANRAVIADWESIWVPRCAEAARAFLGAFPSTSTAADREAALEQVLAYQREVMSAATEGVAA